MPWGRTSKDVFWPTHTHLHTIDTHTYTHLAYTAAFLYAPQPNTFSAGVEAQCRHWNLPSCVHYILFTGSPMAPILTLPLISLYPRPNRESVFHPGLPDHDFDLFLSSINLEHSLTAYIRFWITMTKYQGRKGLLGSWFRVFPFIVTGSTC